jgi:hypothetical protein
MARKYPFYEEGREVPLLTNMPDVEAGEGETLNYISPEVMQEYEKPILSEDIEEGEGYAIGSGGGIGIVSPEGSVSVRGDTIPAKPSGIDMQVMDEWQKFEKHMDKTKYGGKNPADMDLTKKWDELVRKQIAIHGDKAEKTALIKANVQRLMQDVKAEKQAALVERKEIFQLFKAEHTRELMAKEAEKVREAQYIRQDKSIAAERAKLARDERGKLTESSVLTSLGQQFPNPSKATQAYDAYRQYIKDGYDRETAYNYTLKYMQGNYIGGEKRNTQKPKLSREEAIAELKRRGKL